MTRYRLMLVWALRAIAALAVGALAFSYYNAVQVVERAREHLTAAELASIGRPIDSVLFMLPATLGLIVLSLALSEILSLLIPLQGKRNP